VDVEYRIQYTKNSDSKEYDYIFFCQSFIRDWFL